MSAQSDKLIHAILELLRKEGTSASELGPLVRALSPRQVVTLDYQLRARTYSVPYAYVDWDSSFRNEVLQSFESVRRDTCELCIYTCHPSGYVREAAIRALQSVTDPVILPFVCIRLNDWVASISRYAQHIFTAFLTIEHARDLIGLLPVLQSRSLGARLDHTPHLRDVLAVLSRPEVKDECAEVMTGTDTHAARLLLRLIVNARPAEYKSAILSAWYSQDQILRLAAFRLLPQILPAENWSHFVMDATKDRSANVRIAAVRAAAAQAGATLVNAIEECLYDRSASVRHAARVYLRKFKSFDAPTLYRAAISSQAYPRLVGALLGLAESGEPSDAAVVLPHVRSSRPAVAKAAMYALARLGDAKHRSMFVEFLQHNQPGIVRTIAAEVAKRLELIDADDVYTLAAETQPLHVRTAALTLIKKLDVYDALALTLSVLAGAPPDSNLERHARTVAKIWKPSFARGPSRDQVVRVQESFRKVSGRVPMMCVLRQELSRGMFASTAEDPYR